jgi:hypothetical protein
MCRIGVGLTSAGLSPLWVGGAGRLTFSKHEASEQREAGGLVYCQPLMFASILAAVFGRTFPLSSRIYVTTKLEKPAPEPLVIQRLVNSKPRLKLNPSLT